MGSSKLPHVVIVGAGFGGLTAAQSLKKAKVRVTVIDRSNHHLFQPLLYQVATSGLSPADISGPVRSILSGQKNARVLLANVGGVDLARKLVLLEDRELPYDFLILAPGAQNNYFGHDEWAAHAPGLKTIQDALEIRRRVLLAFERAERERSEERRRMLMTFVVIGGGPTGVELAGALKELARYVLAKDFRVIHPASARVVLVEGGPRVLSGFDPSLSEKAEKQLRELGVEVHCGRAVTRIDDRGVELGGELIAASTVLWGAGVRATPLGASLGVPVDRGGRVLVEKDLTLPGHPDAFMIGDAAAFLHQTGQPLPGVSPVAMQQARSVARSIRNALEGKPHETFHYVDKGSMATIGRSRAVAESHGIKLTGFLAWMAWLVVHVWYLIGFRNRLVVMLTWAWSYFTYKRGARIIPEPVDMSDAMSHDAHLGEGRPGHPARADGPVAPDGLAARAAEAPMGLPAGDALARPLATGEAR